MRAARPTLYDLLVHKAIDYFLKNEMLFSIQPSQPYEITEPEALSSLQTFLQHNFSSIDSTSHNLVALQLLQQLLQFHKNDTNPSALINANIERITWINEHALIDNKDSLYKAALQEITASFPENGFTKQAWFLLANYYADKAATYQPFGDTAYRYYYVKAKRNNRFTCFNYRFAQRRKQPHAILVIEHIIQSVEYRSGKH